MTPASICVPFLFMVDLEAMQDRQGRLLGELAELGMAFARELKGKVGEVRSLEEAECSATHESGARDTWFWSGSIIWTLA